MKKTSKESKARNSNFAFAETKLFLEWLTRKESEIVILYGGTPNEKRDCRFATLETEFTIDETLELYKAKATNR